MDYRKTFNKLTPSMKRTLLTAYKQPYFFTRWHAYPSVNDNSIQALERRELMKRVRIPTPFDHSCGYFLADQLTILGALVAASVNERDEV